MVVRDLQIAVTQQALRDDKVMRFVSAWEHRRGAPHREREDDGGKKTGEQRCSRRRAERHGVPREKAGGGRDPDQRGQWPRPHQKYGGHWHRQPREEQEQQRRKAEDRASRRPAADENGRHATRERRQEQVNGVDRKDADARAVRNPPPRRRPAEGDRAERDPRGERRPRGGEQGYNNGNSTWGKRPAPSRARASSRSSAW